MSCPALLIVPQADAPQDILTYLPAFLIWDSTRELVNILWTDDVAQRTILVWIMMLLVAYANNANFVGDAHHTEDAVSEIASSAARRLFIRAESSEEFPGGGRTTAIVLYIVATWTLHLCRFAASFYVFQYKRQFLLHTVWSFVPLAFYIGAIFASERAAIALVAVGLALEYLGWQAIYSPHLKKVFRLTYSSALNSRHPLMAARAALTMCCQSSMRWTGTQTSSRVCVTGRLEPGATELKYPPQSLWASSSTLPFPEHPPGSASTGLPVGRA